MTSISLQIDTNLTFWNWYFTTQYLDEKAIIMWILIRNILFQISSLLRNHSYFTVDSDFDGMLIYWKVHLQSFLYDSLILIFDFSTFAKDRPCCKTMRWIEILLGSIPRKFKIPVLNLVLPFLRQNHNDDNEAEFLEFYEFTLYNPY